MVIGIQQKVARLDVPMDDSLRMDVIECLCNILEPEVDEVLGDVRLLDILHRVRFVVLVQDEIHHEIRHLRLWLNRKIEDADDSRVRQL